MEFGRRCFYPICYDSRLAVVRVQLAASFARGKTAALSSEIFLFLGGTEPCNLALRLRNLALRLRNLALRLQNLAPRLPGRMCWRPRVTACVTEVADLVSSSCLW